MTLRELRFVPYKVQERDFYRWLKKQGYPNYKMGENRCNLYIMRDLTTDDVQEIWDEAWNAAESRQRNGGKDCGP